MEKPLKVRNLVWKISKKFTITIMYLLKKYSINSVLSALILLLILTVDTQKLNASVQATFYVSPKGNDANVGSKAQPFATIAKAQQAVAAMNKNMTGDIVVYLLGGNYTATSQVNLGFDDSGTNGHYVRYTNYRNEKPVISCGTKVKGWTLDSENIYKTYIGTHVDFRQLYVNGRREVRARTPNTGYRTILAKASDGFNIDKGLLAGVSNLQNVEMAINILWMHKRARVVATKDTLNVTRAIINPIEWQAITKEPQGSTDYNDRQYWLENAKEFIDIAGEWYFDKSTGYLYYWPRNKEDIHSSEIVIPAVQTVFNLTGTFDLPVHHIEISGIEIRYTNWSRPNNFGLIDVQANSLIPTNLPNAVDAQYRHNQKKDRVAAAIYAVSASNIKIRNNRFVNLGGNGVTFDAGGNNNSVIGNVFFDLSGGAVEIGNDAREPKDSRMRPVNDSVCNNYMAYIGQEYYGANAVTAYYTDNCIISHNEISHVAYGGISLGWGWSDVDAGHPNLTPHAPKNNKINNNRIDFVSEKLFDTGGIYTDNASDSSEIVGNYITNTVYDVGIFNDEYTHNFSVHDNVLEGNHTYKSTDEGWIRVNGIQKDNTYSNNSDKNFTPANRAEIIANAGLEKIYKKHIHSNLPVLKKVPKPTPTNGGIYTVFGEGYSENGLWLSSNKKGYNESISRYCQDIGASVKWNPSLKAGTYKVSMYNIRENADPSSKVIIAHKGDVVTQTVNLRGLPEGWVELGTYNFSTGIEGYLQLSLSTIGCNVRSNAVKFEKVIAKNKLNVFKLP